MLDLFSEIRLYPFGNAISEQVYEKGDNGYLLVYLKSPIYFMDKLYRKIYVSIKYACIIYNRQS